MSEPAKKMTLYAALQLRAEYVENLKKLRARIFKNIIVMEGAEPAEDPTVLIRKFTSQSAKLKELVRDINLTNSTIKFAFNGNSALRTMTEALAERDELKSNLGLLRGVATEAVPSIRYDSKISTKSVINVQSIQPQADRLSKKVRLLEVAIEEMNWKSELITTKDYEAEDDD